jgi:hypothetical protein
MNDDNGFDEYRRLLIYRLDSLDRQVSSLDRKVNDRMGSLDKKVHDVHMSVTILKTKAAIYGALASAFISAVWGYFKP